MWWGRGSKEATKVDAEWTDGPTKGPTDILTYRSRSTQQKKETVMNERKKSLNDRNWVLVC